MEKIRIAVDAMGADLGAGAVVEGAYAAMAEYAGIEIILVGPEDILRTEMKKVAAAKAKSTGKLAEIAMSVAHAPDVITPDEAPTLAFRRKKESSIVVGLKLVKEGHAHGFVSAGSTGALLTGATVMIGRQHGIERPALGTMLPTPAGHTLLLDSGANMDCKPNYLLQFAQLGTDYMRRVMGRANPSVGLINVGHEDEKGNAAVKEAFTLLWDSELNFKGNIEGREIANGAVEIAVCDGFTGNVVLKFMEGFAKGMLGLIREEIYASTRTKIGGLLAKPAFARIKKRFDYREIGGAPFLGLKQIVIKAHGSSDSLAIKNAIRQCAQYQKGAK
jgi:glycerol-3-phosphate acyltransferase PlsX